jgi:hypothetical protein
VREGSQNKFGFSKNEKENIFRPLNGDEIAARSSAVVSCPSQKDVSVLEKPFSHITKTFNFDKVFSDTSKQVSLNTVIHVNHHV